MQIFFRTVRDIKTFRSNLHLIRCPKCRKMGTMVKHGYKYSYTVESIKQIRSWRIRCSKERKGCGYAPGVTLSGTIPLHCFSASDLWKFIRALKKSRSINAAWNCARIGTTVNTGYRIFKRLLLCQSRLRTNLASRAPPPKIKDTSAPLFQVFEHLKESFGKDDPTPRYQEYFQESILAC